MTRPTISAVMLNYNHAQFLPQAIAGALAQTVPFDEFVIIDDGSTDNSVEIIQSLIKDVPYARLVQNPQNLGVVGTVNVGLRECRSDFIFYMSADDLYSATISELAHEALDSFPDIGMVSGNTGFFEDVVNGHQYHLKLPFPQALRRYTRADLEAVAKQQNVTFFGGANIIRKQAIVDVGAQVPELRWNADWFLYLLIACRHPFAVVPHELVNVRRTPGRYSEASYDWKKQKPVIEAFFRTIRETYPDVYSFFRDNAILPTYDWQSLPLILTRDAGYMTPLLLWRLMVYKSMRGIARMLPMGLIATLRPIFRV